jgi:7-cyano-7-deazaguanine synthase in queuosine biosynthesis
MAPSEGYGDFNTDAFNMRHRLSLRWDEQAFNLLNIMSALRAADRYFVSKGIYEARRTIRLAVEVTNPTRWQKLRDPFSKAVRALSEDILEFYPVCLSAAPPEASPKSDSSLAPGSAKTSPDCVCLYSGGADSFAGVAYLLKHGRRPLLVSHSVGPISGLQKRLFAELQCKFPNLKSEWLAQVRSHPNTARILRDSGGKGLYWQSRDPLQRLRSMFFFSVAAILARGHGLDEIFMCENGLIGAALVFSPRDDNPFTTRPAEPRYLRAMETFLRLALDWPQLTIRNPFQYMTKGEVLRWTADLSLQAALYRTVSCWRSGNRGVRNCGQCVPCLFRQLAFDEAGLPVPSVHYKYRHPIPRRKWRRWRSDELSRLEDIRSYCQKTLKDGIAGLMGSEVAVVDAVDVTGGSVRRRPVPAKRSRDDLAPRKMAATILRFAQSTVRRLP